MYKVPLHLPAQEPTKELEELCKAAVAGAIKPNVNLLEKAIGTPWELELMPDGTVRFKYKILLPVGSADFKEDCLALRDQIAETKRQTILVLKEHPVFNDPPSEVIAQMCKRGVNVGEMKANLKLAFRHLEDAKMRLGKAIQAFDGGKSCYPR